MIPGNRILQAVFVMTFVRTYLKNSDDACDDPEKRPQPEAVTSCPTKASLRSAPDGRLIGETKALNETAVGRLMIATSFSRVLGLYWACQISPANGTVLRCWLLSSRFMKWAPKTTSRPETMSTQCAAVTTRFEETNDPPLFKN